MRQYRATNASSRGSSRFASRRSASSPMARYMAPVSRKSNPRRSATHRATVDFPVPAGPSIVITICGRTIPDEPGGRKIKYVGTGAGSPVADQNSHQANCQHENQCGGAAKASFASGRRFELIGRGGSQFNLKLLNHGLGVGQAQLGEFAQQFDCLYLVAGKKGLLDLITLLFGEVSRHRVLPL